MNYKAAKMSMYGRASESKTDMYWSEVRFSGLDRRLQRA